MWLCVVVVASVAMIASAQNGSQIDACSIDKLVNEAYLLLDKVELDSPKSHSDLVKLREKIHNLKQAYEVNSADSLEPMLAVQSRKTKRNNRNWDAFYESLKGLTGQALKQKMLDTLKLQKTLDYTDSRRFVMLDVDNNDGYVECVYTGKVYRVSSMPNTTTLNIEHSWPQSKGATGIAKADLHHLFPTDPIANSTRSSLPFGVVDNAKWAQGGSECDLKKFEVRKKSRGNTARALFYFSVRYGKIISSDEEETLRKWNAEDPVDAIEKARNDKVEAVQGNRNPFIDHPELINSINDF